MSFKFRARLVPGSHYRSPGLSGRDDRGWSPTAPEDVHLGTPVRQQLKTREAMTTPRGDSGLKSGPRSGSGSKSSQIMGTFQRDYSREGHRLVFDNGDGDRDVERRLHERNAVEDRLRDREWASSLKFLQEGLQAYGSARTGSLPPRINESEAEDDEPLDYSPEYDLYRSEIKELMAMVARLERRVLQDTEEIRSRVRDLSKKMMEGQLFQEMLRSPEPFMSPAYPGPHGHDNGSPAWLADVSVNSADWSSDSSPSYHEGCAPEVDKDDGIFFHGVCLLLHGR